MLRSKGRKTSAIGLIVSPDTPWIILFDGWRAKSLPESMVSSALGLTRVTCDPVSMKQRTVLLFTLSAAMGRPSIAGALATASWYVVVGALVYVRIPSDVVTSDDRSGVSLALGGRPV